MKSFAKPKTQHNSTQTAQQLTLTSKQKNREK